MEDAKGFARSVLGLGPEAGRAEVRARYRELAGSLRRAVAWLRQARGVVPESLVEEVEGHLRRVDGAFRILTEKASRVPRDEPALTSGPVHWTACPSCGEAVAWQGPQARNRICSKCRTSHVAW